MFGNVYAGRRVLVTGHTGFKGSWLALWLQSLGATVSGLALDPDTKPSHWILLALDGVHDHRVDLCDATGVGRVLNGEQPEMIFHLAAQPLVRSGYHNPVGTFASNVIGLVNVLEAVRECPSVRTFVNVTTDKVYAEHSPPDGYGEDDPLGGHDPYSTSKACAELVTDCYQKSFFETRRDLSYVLQLATARAGNVIGGGDWAEDRLVPDLVRASTSGQPLAIRNPDATRPWQHVLEPLSGYLRLGQMLWSEPGFAGAWNFGPGHDSDITVRALATRLQTHWPALQITHDRCVHPHEAAQLRLNTAKAQSNLDWHPVWRLGTALSRTANWYRWFYQQGRINSREDLDAYVEDARSEHASWVV